jgi:hypothetical protein
VIRYAALIALVACGGPKTVDTPPPGTPPAGEQGIRGKLTLAEGDFMPSTDPGPPRGSHTPIPNANVRVFKGPHWTVEQLDPNDPALVATVAANAAGEYSVALDPGTYTVVMERDGSLYLNSFCDNEKPTAPPPAGDDVMTWCMTTVERGTWTENDIEDNSQATY